jgi:protein-S-isoprenylcysteine O-methyltransferase Ste14
MQVLSKLRREPLIEIVIVLAFVILIFEAITFFPVIASLSPALFISLGMAPVIIHSIIAFAADLGMKSELEEEAL